MGKPDSTKPNSKRTSTISPPKGTRDAYPADVLRRRYVTQAWRDASIRCGFDEIEGPTFEKAELYAVKSGDGILGELFQAFSGKSPEEVAQVQEEGKGPYALRPEFTPTLARMYAARAKQLPQPCKWFTAGPYFRAEKPQRGRLREFLQWNVDVVGVPGGGEKAGENAYAEDAKERRDAEMRAEMDAEVILCLDHLHESLGIHSDAVSIRSCERNAIALLLSYAGVKNSKLSTAFALLDGREKSSRADFYTTANEIGLDISSFDNACETARSTFVRGETESMRFRKTTTSTSLQELFKVIKETGRPLSGDEFFEKIPLAENKDVRETRRVVEFGGIQSLFDQLDMGGISTDYTMDPTIVRGLAYYTGTVFEVIAEGERAVAGGGRYDNLIELFGGPPTPACGFGMGDVVLSNLLDDKGLFPEGKELMDAVSRPGASVRPEAFVIHNGSEESRALVRPLVAALRRGVESESYLERGDAKPWDADRYCSGGNGVRPMHARQSYKATGNMGKLKADGVKQHARFVVEVHEADKVELRDLDKGESITSSKGSWSVEPTSEVYVGRGLIGAMG